MLRRMLGKKKGYIVKQIGSVKCHTYMASTDCPASGYYEPYNYASIYNEENQAISFYDGLELSSEDILTYRTGTMITYYIGFNPEDYGSTIYYDTKNNPAYKLINGEVKFKIKSDFRLEHLSKEGNTIIWGEIEVLPEYQA